MQTLQSSQNLSLCPSNVIIKVNNFGHLYLQVSHSLNKMSTPANQSSEKQDDILIQTGHAQVATKLRPFAT